MIRNDMRACVQIYRFNAMYFSNFHLQEQTKLDTTKQAISPEDCDDLSPMPQSQVPPVRRRGGISAEPVTEEDATSYVKKVRTFLLNAFYRRL